MCLTNFRLTLLQPEPHVHLSAHRCRGDEAVLRLLPLVRAPGELAEAEVAARDQGAHPKVLGECERVAIVSVGLIEGIPAGGDIAEQAESPRLVVASTALAGNGQSSEGQWESVLEPVGESVRFS